MVIDNMSHHGVEDGITEKFQPFVVHGSSLLPVHDALVHQGLLVVMDVVGVESQDVVQGRMKFLVLPEKELDSAS
jgi:hypothetical protein